MLDSCYLKIPVSIDFVGIKPLLVVRCLARRFFITGVWTAIAPSARNSAPLKPKVWETIILRTLGYWSCRKNAPQRYYDERCKGVDDVNDLFFF